MRHNRPTVASRVFADVKVNLRRRTLFLCLIKVEAQVGVWWVLAVN